MSKVQAASKIAIAAACACAFVAFSSPANARYGWRYYSPYAVPVPVPDYYAFNGGYGYYGGYVPDSYAYDESWDYPYHYWRQHRRQDQNDNH